MINMVLNTDIESYLRQSNKLIACQQFTRLNSTRTIPIKVKNMFKEVSEDRYEIREWQNVMAAFQYLPDYIKSICTDLESVSNNENVLCWFSRGKCKDISSCSSKEIQHLLKEVYLKIDKIDWERKHNIVEEQVKIRCMITKAHRMVKNPKLKNTLMRVWHGDVFSKQRMYKFKMVENDRCERCDRLETIEHQLFECKDARLIWKEYNRLLLKIGMDKCSVSSYQDIILPTADDNEVSFSLKIIVINMNMWKERPKYNILTFNNYINKYALIEKFCSRQKNGTWNAVMNALKDRSTGLT
jgi:hypothetical protein